MNHVRFVRALLWLQLPLFAQALLTEDLHVTLKNLTSPDGGEVCLKDDADRGCTRFQCSLKNQTAKSSADYSKDLSEEVTKHLGPYSFRTSCAVFTGGRVGARFKLDLDKNYRDKYRDSSNAWSIICGSFNSVPIIIFGSIVLYYFFYRLPGKSKEKNELKNIFRSLGHDPKSILYRKVHDFIYEF